MIWNTLLQFYILLYFFILFHSSPSQFFLIVLIQFTYSVFQSYLKFKFTCPFRHFKRPFVLVFRSFVHFNLLVHALFFCFRKVNPTLFISTFFNRNVVFISVWFLYFSSLFNTTSSPRFILILVFENLDSTKLGDLSVHYFVSEM